MEGHAGTGRVASGAADDSARPEAVESATDADETDLEVADQPSDIEADGIAVDSGRRPSRLGRRWLGGLSAAIALLAAGSAAGGYFALRAHQESQATAHANAAAIEAARDCLAATQAPDSAALPAAQQKILECSTGAFGAQAALYGGMLAQTYEAAKVRVQVSEMRTAVERNNEDGSIDVLAAIRVKVDNVQAQGQEFGYRLRVKMAQEDGQYKIASLDQVSK